jgi:hypothetical protein
MKNFILSILLISNSVFGQKYNFDIHNTSLAEYLKMEERLGSEKIPTTSFHVSFSGEDQPITYLRKEKVIPDLTVYYFFKKVDSTMSYVLYEWNVDNFETKENNQKSKRLQKALIAKYEGLKKNISSEFGEPVLKKNYSNISRLDSINTFVESSTWKSKDSVEIELYATVSNYYNNQGAMTINPVHMIRLYVKNKVKKINNENLKLDDKRLAELDKIKINFLNALKSRNLSNSKEFLSDRIIESVTDEQIIKLIENINFEIKTELIYSGLYMGINGSMNTVLHYKYSNDNSSPPTEMIKLTFDEKDKILGIHPIKLQNK